MKFARPFCGCLGLFFLLVFSAKAADPIPFKKYGFTPAQAAARLLDRFSFGAKPGQVDAVVAMGIDNWFEQQVMRGKINLGNAQKKVRALDELERINK